VLEVEEDMVVMVEREVEVEVEAEAEAEAEVKDELEMDEEDEEEVESRDGSMLLEEDELEEVVVRLEPVDVEAVVETSLVLLLSDTVELLAEEVVEDVVTLVGSMRTQPAGRGRVCRCIRA
jgi:hypothetical protein